MEYPDRTQDGGINTTTQISEITHNHHNKNIELYSYANMLIFIS